MGVLDASLEILREAGEPLHAKEIAKRILAKKIWSTDGQTPHATVSARLYADIKKKGDTSPVVQTGPQTFGLRSGVVARTPAPPKTARGNPENSGNRRSRLPTPPTRFLRSSAARSRCTTGL